MELNVLDLRSINRTTKPGQPRTYVLQHGLLNSLSPLLRPIAQGWGKKRFLSKYCCSLAMHLLIQGTMMEMDSEINVVVMPAHTACIVQPTDQGVISLRNIFYKAVAAIDKYSSYGSDKTN